jgi:hypothetical protein
MFFMFAPIFPVWNNPTAQMSGIADCPAWNEFSQHIPDHRTILPGTSFRSISGQ